MPDIPVTEDALQREVVALREHVAELQRRMARFDDAGHSERIAGLDVTISEREELLVAAERIVHMGSWIWDVEADKVSWSDELYRILGYDPVTEPASVQRFFEAVHPDDLPRVQADSALLASTGISPEGLFRVRRRDGMIRHVQANGAALFDSVGKLRRIVGTILDITESREAALQIERANKLLQSAQSLAHLGIFARDFSRTTPTWSRELFRILGIDEGVTPARDLFLRHVHPDDVERLRAVLTRLEEPSAVVPESEDPIDVRIVRPDGEIRHVRVRASFERGADGSDRGVHGIVQDVTDATLLGQRLARAEKMETIGRLAGGIAHDFNNIMTVIHGGAELLGTSDASDLEILEVMKAAVSSARELTSRLLAFGRQSTLRLQRVSPNDIVRDTVRLVTRILGEHVTLETVLDPTAPAATLDPHLTGQALINLLINARDAMPGGGTILLSTRRLDGPTGQLVELGVRDSGPGIAASLRDKVFEPFFTTKREGHGTGLGLAMVQGAVEQQGGTITLESGPGGTLFMLRFAAAPVEGDNVSRARGGEAPSARRLRILVVEDQESLANMVQRLLQRAGHEVWVCTLPSQALERYRLSAHEIDLILSDVLMPEMSGMEMVERFQAIAPLPRVLFMSGYGAEAVRTLGRDRNVLAKPFTQDELLRAIARELEQ